MIMSLIISNNYGGDIYLKKKKWSRYTMQSGVQASVANVTNNQQFLIVCIAIGSQPQDVRVVDPPDRPTSYSNSMWYRLHSSVSPPRSWVSLHLILPSLSPPPRTLSYSCSSPTRTLTPSTCPLTRGKSCPTRYPPSRIYHFALCNTRANTKPALYKVFWLISSRKLTRVLTKKCYFLK